MTEKEKLIELLKECAFIDAAGIELIEKKADYLLSNGVTLQRWIPVTERLPPENTRVLLFVPNVAEGGNVRIGVLEPIKLWFTDGRDRLLYAQVTHWMPLPEAPKEDKP